MSQIWDIYCKHCLWSIFGPCWCTKSCKTTFYAHLSRIWKLARFTRFIRKVFATKILLSGKFLLFVTLLESAQPSSIFFWVLGSDQSKTRTDTECKLVLHPISRRRAQVSTCCRWGSCRRPRTRRAAQSRCAPGGPPWPSSCPGWSWASNGVSCWQLQFSNWLDHRVCYEHKHSLTHVSKSNGNFLHQ